MLGVPTRIVSRWLIVELAVEKERDLFKEKHRVAENERDEYKKNYERAQMRVDELERLQKAVVVGVRTLPTLLR